MKTRLYFVHVIGNLTLHLPYTFKPIGGDKKASFLESITQLILCQKTCQSAEINKNYYTQ